MEGLRACLLVLAVVACSKGKEPPSAPGARATKHEVVSAHDYLTGKPIPLDAIPEEILGEAARIGAEQARGFDGGTIRVHRVWNYRGASYIKPFEDAKLVAIEMTIEVPRDNHLDLDDLDIIDAATGDNYGSDPQLQRVTADGAQADWDDAVFGPESRYRFIAVWAVPKTTQAVKIGYWGQTITDALPIGDSGPALVEVTENVIAYGTAGRTGAGLTRHLIGVECFCARNASAPSYTIFDAAKKAWFAVRTVEVDQAFQPLPPGKRLATYYGKRWWVLEVWSKDETGEIRKFGRPVTKPARKLVPSNALLTALERAELDEYALESMKAK